MKSLVCFFGMFHLVAAIPAATFTVLNTNDLGPGSFRQAILDSDGTAATNTISFNIPGSGLRVIRMLSALPRITRSVTIDGFTQPGASAKTLSNGNDANWLIELDGSLVTVNQAGLDLGTAATVRGLRISNFQRQGIYVSGDNCIVAGCFIYSNGEGIQLEETENTMIGGTVPGDRNVISGNSQAGITFDDGARFNQVAGNFIGTDVSGTGNLGNQGPGIHVVGHVSDIRIGGTNTGEGNVIAFNNSDGVQIDFFLSQNNSIRGNRISSNRRLGIDLIGLPPPPGVTTNDLGDGDFGANLFQNFPLITNAVITSTTTTIQGWLNSQSNTQYTLDFYGNTEGDISGHGEGERYLGSASVTTDENGNGTFDVTLPFPLGDFYVTATATDPLGNTSEFSPSWPQPLRLEFTELFGEGRELILSNVDGSAISSERLSGLGVLAGTNLSPQSVWEPIPNSLELTNGLVRVLDLELTNGIRFFRNIEQRAPVPPQP